MPTFLNLKKYQQMLLLGFLFLISLPIVTTFVQILFTCGNYVGTIIRMIGENGVCF